MYRVYRVAGATRADTPTRARGGSPVHSLQSSERVARVLKKTLYILYTLYGPVQFRAHQA
jgi:hypothetical protein